MEYASGGRLLRVWSTSRAKLITSPVQLVVFIVGLADLTIQNRETLSVRKRAAKLVYSGPADLLDEFLKYQHSISLFHYYFIIVPHRFVIIVQ